MKVGSLFAGIGGFDLGFERAGFEVAWCVEIDRNARAVLARRFPKARILEDVTKVDPHDLETVDVICGGFPCQDLSVAGKRAGLAGARSGLFHDAMRIVRTVRPRLLVLENVPGLLSSNRGLDFATVLREVGEGWSCEEVAWRVLDSQFFRVAQRRRRVFIVGSSRSGCAEEVLALAEGSGGNPPSRGEARQGVAVDAARCADGGCWWDGSDCAATLTKQNANGSQRMPDKGNLGAVVQAYRWQNYREGLVSDDIVGLRASAGASGFHEMNHPLVAVCVTGDKTHSLTSIGSDASEDGTGRGTPMVAHAFYSTGGTHGVNMIPELCPPLKIGSALEIPSPPAVAVSFDWQKGNDVNNPRASTMNVSVEQTQTLSTTRLPAVAFKTGNSAKARSDGMSEEQSPTLCGNGGGNTVPAVAFSCKDHGADAPAVAPTLRAMPHSGSHANGGGQVAVAFAQNQVGEIRTSETMSTIGTTGNASARTTPKIMSGMVVRRLTPVECERLQGFTDGWTDIGTMEKPTADTHRYKQLGNAVTVNVAEWIARRAHDALTKEAP